MRRNVLLVPILLADQLLTVLLICGLTTGETATLKCTFQGTKTDILDRKWIKVLPNNTDICLLSSNISHWYPCNKEEGGIQKLSAGENWHDGEISLSIQNLSASDAGIYRAEIEFTSSRGRSCTFHLLPSGHSTLIEENTQIKQAALGHTAQLKFPSRRNLASDLLHFKLFNALNTSLVQCGHDRACSSNPNSGAATRFLGRVTDSSIVVAINATKREDSGLYRFEMAYKTGLPTTGQVYLRVYKSQLQDKGSEEVRPTAIGKDLPGVKSSCSAKKQLGVSVIIPVVLVCLVTHLGIDDFLPS
ncbi:uncharacterized protein LOC106150575 isoform X2 [Lingula anatina]|uniref:Uncharacterized protein LOC106150575 isoform X2 n=1 Tax=Lingula anatina TaxID=7574 RepID=A0A1S3H190_LINAN|nr:uncharacterized protein LOC106150575 isoform X2 [Lingula anatina]|eukprot:XP_013378909.1 uncharacterized protein LOC106150575 isoform X2 [Lingula anatina]